MSSVPVLKTYIILRIAHGVITFFFLMCIIQIYYSLFTHTHSILLYLVLIAVNVEGIILARNKWDCPLIYVHRKFGDDKYFFQLLFPKKIAKLVIPVVAVITLTGELLLLLESFKLF